MSSRRRLAALVAVFGLATRLAALEPPVLFGFARISGGSVDAAPSFLNGGFGKLVAGGRPGDRRANALIGEARLGLDWEPAIGWRLFLHGVARGDENAASASPASGLLEAFAERRFGFATGSGASQEIALRLGQFFLPSSRENVGPLWSSPYTLTLSAMNSWIAEEIRPIGLDASWRRTFANDQRLELAGTVFGGNDTSGTLMAWRGYSLHDRPTPTGQFVPLPPFPGRSTEFPAQSARGTEPFGSDLDGRPGWAGRARWDAPAGRAVVQVTIFRNEGDRALHGDQYAWDTDFRWLSAELELLPGLRLLGEWGTGTSLMGFAPPGGRSPAQVDIRYDLLYLLATWERGRLRATVRFDDARIDDRDSNPLDSNFERGEAWTFALLGQLGERWRLGAEFLAAQTDRPAAQNAASPALDATSFRLELRYAIF